MTDMIKFIFMVVFEIPAIFFSIVILTYFSLNREARAQLKNQGWFTLIIVNLVQILIDLPMPMSYYRMGVVWPATNAYCVWWTWCEFSLSTIGLFLMTWISIERHILIFHSNALLQKPWRKWTFHTIPITLCVVWTPIFYLGILIIFPFCTNDWDFNSVNCGTPCYFNNFLGKFDFIFNVAIPLTVIMLTNLTLVIRVIHQKRSRQLIIKWRLHRKMVIQLWMVSSLYMAFWLPMTITQVIKNSDAFFYDRSSGDDSVRGLFYSTLFTNDLSEYTA